jgi:hypothetical protein
MGHVPTSITCCPSSRYIVDPETGKNVAVIRHGEVFRRDKEGVRIATVSRRAFFRAFFLFQIESKFLLKGLAWDLLS